MFLSKQQDNKVFFYHGKDICPSSNGGVIKHKRSSYNQSPNMTPKNMNEKSVSSSATEVSKGLNDVIVNNVPSTEAHKVGLNAKSDMVNNFKAIFQVHMGQPIGQNLGLKTLGVPYLLDLQLRVFSAQTPIIGGQGELYFTLLLDKERKEAKSKDESLKKLEESLHNLTSSTLHLDKVVVVVQGEVTRVKPHCLPIRLLNAYKELWSSVVSIQTRLRGMDSRNKLQFRRQTKATINIQKLNGCDYFDWYEERHSSQANRGIWTLKPNC
ncbi:hypothetical protein FXO38_25269 [Capsicum annuum]|nr:hypothetical protein FXO38_25269 [Capsicum annuum]